MPVPQLRNGLKLGLKTAHPKPIPLLMGRYLDRSKLPQAPKSFGHYGLVQSFGMLGNDTVGDCLWAAACHQTMVWNAEAKRSVSFSPKSAIQAYSEATGYDPSKTDADGNNATDGGTDMAEGCAYWRNTGIPDDLGGRHKIEAFLAFDPTDVEARYTATWLFSGSLLGINLPQSAEDQFDRNEPWTYVPGSPSLGGHCINDFGRADGLDMLGTWGRVQPSYGYALSRMVMQGAAIVTSENLVSNKSPDGFDLEGLLADLKILGAPAVA